MVQKKNLHLSTRLSLLCKTTLHHIQQSTACTATTALHGWPVKALKMKNLWHGPLLRLTWTLLRTFGPFSSRKFKVNSTPIWRVYGRLWLQLHKNLILTNSRNWLTQSLEGLWLLSKRRVKLVTEGFFIFYFRNVYLGIEFVYYSLAY